MKRCAKCGEEKPATLEFFHRNKMRKDGLAPYCKVCRNTYHKSYRRRPEAKARRLVTWKNYCSRHGMKERLNAYHKRPDLYAKKLVYNQNRHARKMSVPGSHTPEQSREQYERQKGKCYWCKKKVTWGKHHEDHVIPLSREGSSNDISNIVIACPHCNQSKHDKYPWEFPEGGRLL